MKAVYRGRQLPRNQAIQTLYYSVFLRLTNIASWSYICKLLIAPSAIQPKWVDINVSTLRPQAHRTRSQYCLLIAFISPHPRLGSSIHHSRPPFSEFPLQPPGLSFFFAYSLFLSLTSKYPGRSKAISRVFVASEFPPGCIGWRATPMSTLQNALQHPVELSLDAPCIHNLQT